MTGSSNAPAGDRPQNVGVVVIHGNGEADPGWINEWLIEPLHRHLGGGTPEAKLALNPESIVYSLPDSGSSDPKATFSAWLRRGRVDQQTDVTFAELFWADLSRVGYEPLYKYFALLRLFYEAPNVLTLTFLAKSRGVYLRFLRGLILAPIWLIRWVVSGLNIAAFSCLFMLVLISSLLNPIKRLYEVNWPRTPVISELTGPLLARTLIAALILTAGAAVFLARRSERDHWGLTEIFKSTFGFALLGLGIVATMLVTGQQLTSVADYLSWITVVAVLIWIPWSILIFAAIVGLTLLSIKRAFISGGPDSAPLHRIGAALVFAVVQGLLWKVTISPLGVIAINLFKPATPIVQCKAPALIYLTLTTQERLRCLESDLLDIFTINGTVSIVVFFLGLVLMRCPRWIHGFMGGDLEKTARFRPRIIIAPVLMTALLSFAAFTMIYFHGTRYGVVVDQTMTKSFVGQYLLGSRTTLTTESFELLLQITATLLLIAGVLLFAFGTLQRQFGGILHFARDIVDHQYRPRRTAIAQAAEATGIHLPGADPAKSTNIDLGEDFGAWPRRDRINRRLDELMRRVILQHGFDRLIFLTHSQGTVIMHDYFRTGNTNEILKTPRDIHALTVGSPITHLYQFYFREYSDVAADPTWLPANLGSWRNMFRIDDPIGNRVTIGTKDVVHNTPLGPGGHTDYWREPLVMKTVYDMITRPFGTPRVEAVGAVAPSTSRA